MVGCSVTLLLYMLTKKSVRYHLASLSIMFRNNISFCFRYSVMNYDRRNLEIPAIDVLGPLLVSGIRVLVYRYTSKVFHLLVKKIGAAKDVAFCNTSF